MVNKTYLNRLIRRAKRIILTANMFDDFHKWLSQQPKEKQNQLEDIADDAKAADKVQKIMNNSESVLEQLQDMKKLSTSLLIQIHENQEAFNEIGQGKSADSVMKALNMITKVLRQQHDSIIKTRTDISGDLAATVREIKEVTK